MGVSSSVEAGILACWYAGITAWIPHAIGITGLLDNTGRWRVVTSIADYSAGNVPRFLLPACQAMVLMIPDHPLRVPKEFYSCRVSLFQHIIRYMWTMITERPSRYWTLVHPSSKSISRWCTNHIEFSNDGCHTYTIYMLKPLITHHNSCLNPISHETKRLNSVFPSHFTPNLPSK